MEKVKRQAEERLAIKIGNVMAIKQSLAQLEQKESDELTRYNDTIGMAEAASIVLNETQLETNLDKRRQMLTPIPTRADSSL